jgi:hypothetical protein
MYPLPCIRAQVSALPGVRAPRTTPWVSIYRPFGAAEIEVWLPSPAAGEGLGERFPLPCYDLIPEDLGGGDGVEVGQDLFWFFRDVDGL